MGKVLGLVLLLLVGVATASPITGENNNMGSNCEGVSCLPSPGDNCTPKYKEKDECCPVWHCGGQYGELTSFGKTESGDLNGFGKFISEAIEESSNDMRGQDTGFDLSPIFKRSII